METQMMSEDYQLCVLKNGQWDIPTFIPDFYATPALAKDAGRQYLVSNPECQGVWIRKVWNGGKYRTVTLFGQEDAP